MMRVFICPNCGEVRVVSKFLKATCYGCNSEMEVCKLPYLEWVDLSEEERDALCLRYIEAKKDS